MIMAEADASNACYEQIIADVCSRHGISKALLVSMRRSEALFKARVECSKLLRAEGLSLPKIGRLMSRHHTTILHHVKEVERG
jgi:chromosomal replication initiation ATPase DnaA